MSRFFDSFSERHDTMMDGRNGADGLCRFTTIVAIACLILALFVLSRLFLTLALVFFALSYWRMFSKNLMKRRQENDAYLQFKNKIIGGFKTSSGVRDQKKKYGETHKFFKCRQCGHTLMVPKGKGKIRVKCPHCGYKFDAKS